MRYRHRLRRLERKARELRLGTSVEVVIYDQAVGPERVSSEDADAVRVYLPDNGRD